MSLSTDVIHGGHIRMIENAASLGDLTIGVLNDKVVASYKRFPLLSCRERMKIASSLQGVAHVIEQDEMSYRKVIRDLKPDIIVHGDDWRTGLQQPIREEVIQLLSEYGGELKEFPYTVNEEYEKLEAHARMQLSMPDMRRGRLKNLLGMKGLITAMEAHSGITGLIVENTTVVQDGKTYQFDAMWISSLCDSTAKGKPDIELVDMTSRFRTIDDIMEVTTKPIIFDGDTGGAHRAFYIYCQVFGTYGR